MSLSPQVIFRRWILALSRAKARRVIPAIAFFLGSASIGVAQAEQPNSFLNDAERQEVARVVDGLKQSKDADGLAGAALWQTLYDREQALALFAQASALEPQRADLLLLHLLECKQQPGCDARPLENRLSVLDPANGWIAMGQLQEAVGSGNKQGQLDALAAIGASQGVDLYWTALVAKLSRAVARNAGLPQSNVLVATTGILVAIALPPLMAPVRACSKDNLQRADFLKACRSAASGFARSDTILLEGIGTSISLKMMPVGSPEYLAAQETRKQRSALNRSVGEIDLEAMNPQQIQAYIDVMLRNRREQDFFKDLLVSQGKSVAREAN